MTCCGLPSQLGPAATSISVEALDGVAPLAHLRDQQVAMLRVAREERQLDARVADENACRLALVLDFHDIHALGREEVEELRELAGVIGELGADDEVAAAEREPAPHHLHHE